MKNKTANTDDLKGRLRKSESKMNRKPLVKEGL